MGLCPVLVGALLVLQARWTSGPNPPGEGSKPLTPTSKTWAPSDRQQQPSSSTSRPVGAAASGAGEAPSTVVPGSTATNPTKSAATQQQPTGSGSSGSSRTAVADWVSEAFRVPVGGTIVGRPIRLREAIASAQQREMQREATHAYWRLAEAVGQYGLRYEAVEQLRELEGRADDVLRLRSVRAQAIEALRTAEMATLRAQRTLVEAARLGAGSALPLPADLPHAGPYRTNFDEVYAMQSVSVRARLVHRMLPWRRRGIEARAMAVQAACDALDAAKDSYRAGTVGLETVLDCLAQLTEQRARFVADVCQYNHDIAEYAWMVAGISSSPQTLVAMLILPANEAVAPQEVELGTLPRALPERGTAGLEASGVEPAAWLVPIPESESQGMVTGIGGAQPPLAPPKPTPEPAKSPQSSSDPIPKPPKPTPEPEKPAVRTAQRAVAPPGPDNADPSLAWYPGLVNASPAVRVKHLSQALHWNRHLPGEAGRPIELSDCLNGLAPTDRRGVIEAYWLARQRAAEYEVLASQLDLLEQLVPAVLEHRARPTGPLDMLRLRAAHRASQAELFRMRVELTESQFELTRRAGRAVEGPWLLPTTDPHAGPYLLKLEAQQPELVKSPAVQRLAGGIAVLGEKLQSQAAAVIEADRARASATAEYQATGRGIEPVLACLESQTAESLAFLQMLTGYNRAIAEYVLTVLPPSIPGGELVQTLVIVR